MRRAVIFDFGGVLMKTLDHTGRHLWDDRLGLSRGSVEKIVHGGESWRKAQRGEITPAEYWADVAAQLALDNGSIQQLAADFFSGDRLDAALIDYIHELRGLGHQVALLSNDSLELVAKLRRLAIAGLFDPLVISAQIGVMKPDARAYEAVLAAFNRPAAETIFVDDMVVNVEAAAALGIHAVQYVQDMDLRAVLAPLLESENSSL